MLQRTALVLVVGLTGACGAKGQPVTPGPGGAMAPAVLADPASESLGGVSLGDPAAKVEAALGAPTTKGEVQEWAATGDRVSTWPARARARSAERRRGRQRRGGPDRGWSTRSRSWPPASTRAPTQRSSCRWPARDALRWGHRERARSA